MGDFLPKADKQNDENFDDFVTQNCDPKSKLDTFGLVRMISIKVRQHKLDYNALRYIFRLVRERCEIEVPRQEKRLLELPTAFEMNKFYAVIDNPVHQLLFEVLEGTGLRVSELCSLEVARIDFATNTIFVFQGKGKKDRICVMGNRLKEKIALFVEGKKLRYLFENSRHDKFSTRRIEQLCGQYKKTAGVHKDLTPHTFRHIWNTKLASANLPKEKRAILAGHASDKTQDIYTHLALGDFKSEVIAILDGANLKGLSIRS